MCVNANDLDFKGKKIDSKSVYEYSICPFEIEKPKFANFISIDFKLNINSNENTDKKIEEKDDENDSFYILNENKIEKRNQEKSNFLIQELLSIYIIKFYSCVLMRMT